MPLPILLPQTAPSPILIHVLPDSIPPLALGYKGSNTLIGKPVNRFIIFTGFETCTSHSTAPILQKTSPIYIEYILHLNLYTTTTERNDYIRTSFLTSIKRFFG